MVHESGNHSRHFGLRDPNTELFGALEADLDVIIDSRVTQHQQEAANGLRTRNASGYLEEAKREVLPRWSSL